MRVNTEGLVLAEQKLAGEKRLLTILTRNKGIMHCFVKENGSLAKNQGAAISVFSYSDFSVYEGKKSCSLDEAVSKSFFYNLMFDIEKLALAQYMCELAIHVIPEGDCDPECLSLMLNSFYLLNENKRSLLTVKSVFELRLMTLSGFMPDIVGCRGCGVYTDDVMYFDFERSCLWCRNCLKGTDHIPLSPDALNGLRTAVLAEPKRIFSFSAGENDICTLADLAEKYTLKITDRSFRALDYYKNIRIQNN